MHIRWTAYMVYINKPHYLVCVGHVCAAKRFMAELWSCPLFDVAVDVSVTQMLWCQKQRHFLEDNQTT